MITFSNNKKKNEINEKERKKMKRIHFVFELKKYFNICICICICIYKRIKLDTIEK